MSQSSLAARVGALLVVTAASCASGVRTGRSSGKWLEALREPFSQKERRAARWLITFAGNEASAQLDSAGRRLVYASDRAGSLDIWIRDLASGVQTRITKHDARDTHPTFAPDGKTVAFVSTRDDSKGDIFLWHDGDLERLTDDKTADDHPAFSPDGKHLLFSAQRTDAPVRIEAIELDTKRRWRVVDDADDPALSPDGKRLAVTRVHHGQRTRVAVYRLDAHLRARGAPRFTDDGHYNAVCPAFSHDGQALYFVRFYRGPPDRPRPALKYSSLWRLPLSALRADPRGREAALLQLTSSTQLVLYPSPTERGVLATAQFEQELDIGALPTDGVIPRRPTAADQLKLALAQRDPWVQLVALRRVFEHDRSPARDRALRLSAALLLRLGEIDKARQRYRQLAREGAPRAQLIARIELAAFFVRAAKIAHRRRRPGGHHRPRRDRPELAAATRRLSKLAAEARRYPATEALLALRRADIQRSRGDMRGAIAAYREVLARYPKSRETGAEASLKLVDLLRETRRPTPLLVEHYLALFRRYPGQRYVLEDAAEAAVTLFDQLPLEQRPAPLERLIQHQRRNVLLAAAGERRLAQIYRELHRPDLALGALERLETLQLSGRLVDEDAGPRIERQLLELAELSRKRGRYAEAERYQQRLLGRYEKALARRPRDSRTARRLRRRIIDFAVQHGERARRRGQLDLAYKYYSRAARYVGQRLRVERGLILIGIARGQRSQLLERYRREPETSDVRQYALGLLATYADDPDEGDLERAAEHLQRARDISPLDPVIYLALGWVAEMQHRYLGQRGGARLEDAVVSYERALELNDELRAPHIEADAMHNLVTAYVELGTGWEQAEKLCRRRAAIGIPYHDSKREVQFRLSCGRTAIARSSPHEAQRQLSRALDLARQLGDRALAGVITARLAYAAQSEADYAHSSALFRRAKEEFARTGRQGYLALLQRDIALNSLLLGRPQRALAELRRAEQLLARHGTVAVGRWREIGLKVGSRSTAPFGWDVEGEHLVHLGLKEIAYANQGRWRAARDTLERLAQAKRETIDRGPKLALQRELLLIRARLAMAELELGHRDRFRELSRDLLRKVGEIQREKEVSTRIDEVDFVLQVAIALNLAEAELFELVPTQRRRCALRDRLWRLERRRERWVKTQLRPLLPSRVRYALWNDTALLLVSCPAHFDRGHGAKSAVAAAVRASDDGPRGGERGTAPADGSSRRRRVRAALASVGEKGAAYIQAVRLLRSVVHATRPGAEQREPRWTGGHLGLGALWAPLDRAGRLRRHARATLNLARVATILADERNTAGTAVIRELVRARDRLVGAGVDSVEVDVIDAEIAWRERDLEKVRRVVDRYLARSPMQLELDELTTAVQPRRWIMRRARSLALKSGRVGLALELAEREERRAFVEALVALPPRGSGAAAGPLRRLQRAVFDLRAARRYRKRSHPATRSSANARSTGAGRAARVTRANEELVRARAALLRSSPAVAALFDVPPFPWKRLREALGHAIAISALIGSGNVYLVAVDGGQVRWQRLDRSPAELRRIDRDQLERELVAPLDRLIAKRGEAPVVYLDLGRLRSGLRPAISAETVVALDTLWELVDATAHLRPPLRRAVVLGGGSRGERAARVLGAPRIDSAELGWRTGKKARAESERARAALRDAGWVVIADPVRFDVNPLNVSLPAGRDRRGIPRFAWPAQALGQPLAARVVVLLDVEHARRTARSERVALARLAHSFGASTVIALERDDAATLDKLARCRRRSASHTLAAACYPLGIVVRGAPGLSPKTAEARAETRSKRLLARGVLALRDGREAEATAALQTALDYLKLAPDARRKARALWLLAHALRRSGGRSQAARVLEQLVELLERSAASRSAGDDGRHGARSGDGAARAGLVGMITSPHAAAEIAPTTTGTPPPVTRSRALERLVRELSAIDAHRQARARASELVELSAGRSVAIAPARAWLLLAAVAERAGDVRTARRAALRAHRAAQRAAGSTKAALVSRVESLLARARLERTTSRRPNDGLEHLLRHAEAQLARRGDHPVLASLAPAVVAERALRAQRARRFGRAIELARRARALVAQRATGRAAAPKNLREAERYGLLLAELLYEAGGIRQALATVERTRRCESSACQLLAAQLLAATGRRDKAGRRFARALAGAPPQERGRLLRAFAWTLAAAGLDDDARSCLTRAILADRAHRDRRALARHHYARGILALGAGLSVQAGRDLRRAHRLARAAGDGLTELRTTIGLGRLDLGRDADVQRAIERLSSAAKLARHQARPAWRWRALLWRARARRKAGDDEGALGDLQRARTVAEKLRELPPNRWLARGATTDAAEIYDELIALQASRGAKRAALDTVVRLARYRARRLLEAHRVLGRGGPPASRVPLSPSGTGALVADARRRGGESTTVVYYAARDELLAWVVDGAQGSVELVRRQSVDRTRLLHALEELRVSLSAFRPSGPLLRELHRWFVADIWPPVKDGSRPRRMTVMADARLRGVPFAALEDRKQRVIDRYVVERLRVAPRRPDSPSSASGGERYRPALSLAYGDGGDGRRELPFADQEARAVARALGSAEVHRLDATHATRAAFERFAPRADLIHIAAHGSYRRDEPLGSALLLTDGELSASEVLDTSLSASLVILSACANARPGSDVPAGASLAHAFLLAGADRVLSSNGRVSDLTTALLVKHTIRRLASGRRDPARALARAQRWLSQRYTHPAFWALLGVERPLR